MLDENSEDGEEAKLNKKEQRNTIIALSVVTLLILLVPILLFLSGLMMFFALMSGIRFMDTKGVVDATYMIGYAITGGLFLWGFRKLIRWFKK